MTSLRSRLFLLIALALLPVVALNLWSHLETRKLALAGAVAEAEHAVHLANAQQAQVLERSRLGLTLLATLPQIRDALGDPGACGARLGAARAALPDDVSFLLVDAGGMPLCGSAEQVPRVSFADRSWFRRALDANAFATGDFVMSRVDGRALLPNGVPLPLADGSTGVLASGIDLTWLGDYLAGLALPPGTRVTVLDRDHTVLAAFPDGTPGSTFALPERLALLDDAAGGSRREGDTLRVLEPLSGSLAEGAVGAWVLVELPLGPVLGDLNRKLTRDLLGALLLAATALLLAGGLAQRGVARPVAQLAQALAGASRGDFRRVGAPASGLRELARLREAFNRMTDSLGARQRENDCYRAELEEKERRFRGIFHSTFQFIGLMSPDGTLLEANRTALEFGGLEPAEVIGRPFWECRWWTLDAATQEQLREAVARAAAGEPVRYHARVRGAGDAVAVIDFTIKPVFDEAGEVSLLIPEGHDITELRRALDEVNRRASRSQLLYDISSQPGRALEAQIDDALARTCDILGLDVGILSRVEGERYTVQAVHSRGPELEPGAEFALGDTYCALLLEADEVLAIDHMGRSEQRHHPCYRSFGLECYIGVAVQVDGEIYGTLNFSSAAPRARAFDEVDVGLLRLLGQWVGSVLKRQRIEQALLASEARHRGVVASLAEGVVVQAADGSVTAMNDSAPDILGHGVDALLGRASAAPSGTATWRVLREDGSELPAAELPARRTLADGLPRSGELVGVMAPDGACTWLMVNTRPIPGDEGPEGAPGVVSSFADITERVEARAYLEAFAEDLARSNEELEQFASIASHDLREPLRVIAGYSQLLARRYRHSLDDDAHEFLGFIVDGVERMNRLITDLLAFSRLGRRSLDTRPVALATLLDEVRAQLALLLDEHHAELELVADATLQGDPNLLRQLLQNLVSNAVKFRGEAPPRVEVGARLDGDEWRLWVRDNGIGIAPDYHERVFAIFQRLHARDAVEGTGIGLALVRRIAERHDGRVELRSDEGRGSTFTVVLPVRGAGAADPAPETAAGAEPIGAERTI